MNIEGQSMDTNGTQYDYDLSAMVATIIGAEPLRCWRNASLAVYHLPNLFASGTYIEGWIVVPRKKVVVIIEHGWSKIPDLGIVDPSIVLTEQRSQRIFYFPGYVLSRSQLCDLLSGSTLPLVCHTSYGDDGMKHKGYQDAYRQAWQHARDLAKEKRLPQTAIKVSRRDSWRGVTIFME